MNTDEFAKYVIDNMHRATLVNALKVSTKLNNNEYNVNEFIDSALSYISNLLSSNKISCEKANKLSVVFYETKSDYNSEFNYNKFMILNDMVIRIWKILGR